MPEILTYNSSSEVEKKRTKQSAFRSLFDFFNSKDKFTKLSLITFALIIIATPFIVNQYLGYRQNASSNRDPITWPFPGGAKAGAANLPTFTVSGVAQVSKEIGPDGNNPTQNVDVCGTDLGSMFDWNGKIYNVFGDTFGCPLNPNQPNWRSNTLATTTDANPSDGITFGSWIVGADGKAKELIANDAGPVEETAIPTYGVSIGTTGYLYYFEGQIAPSWTCKYSSVAKSTDGGQNWTKLTSLKWAPGNFNQVAIYKKNGYVYFFGIPCARAGSAKMMRVLESSIENKAAYEYLTGYDAISNPIWTTNAESLAITIVSAPVGELSVRFNNYLGQFIMMYLRDVAPYTIELRSAPNLWGPWSSPQAVTTGTTYPCVYAPYMREGYDENNGQTVYFRLSRFCPGFNPYSTYWMKMTLNVTGPSPTPTPLVVDSDRDGFLDTVEVYMGTDPNKACGVNAWPPDVDGDGAVTILDMTNVANAFLTRIGDPKYNKRLDMDADGAITILDLTTVSNYFLQRCTNPVMAPVASRPDVADFIPKQSPTPVPSPSPTPVRAKSACYDVTGDKIVNDADVQAVLAHVGQAGKNLIWDVNKSGAVSIADVGVEQKHLGETCK